MLVLLCAVVVCCLLLLAAAAATADAAVTAVHQAGDCEQQGEGVVLRWNCGGQPEEQYLLLQHLRQPVDDRIRGAAASDSAQAFR